MPDLTPDQQAALQQERFIQQVLETRGLIAQKKPPSNPWLDLLQSSAGVALITVVIGTIGGTLITAILQHYARNRETRTLAYSEFLRLQRQTVNDAFVLIGKSVAASQDVATISSKPFYTGPGDNLDKVQEQELLTRKNAITEAFNKADTEWRQQRETVGLLLHLYNNDDSVVHAWDNTAAAVTHLMDCEGQFNLRYRDGKSFASIEEAHAACAAEKQSLSEAEKSLTVALSTLQRAALTGNMAQ